MFDLEEAIKQWHNTLKNIEFYIARGSKRMIFEGKPRIL
jgi:hypothetical protein